jgi:hypothetical protein
VPSYKVSTEVLGQKLSNLDGHIFTYETLFIEITKDGKVFERADYLFTEKEQAIVIKNFYKLRLKQLNSLK